MALHREIGLASATFLVIGNVIGVGIFVTSGHIAEQIGASGWLIGVWLLGGALALIGALCYAKLGILFPKAGGEYAFLRPSYGPFAAFLSGWASLFIGFTAPIAASALGLAAFAVQLIWQIGRLDISDPALCLRLFKSNRDAGLILFAGMIADALWR